MLANLRLQVYILGGWDNIATSSSEVYTLDVEGPSYVWSLEAGLVLQAPVGGGAGILY